MDKLAQALAHFEGFYPVMEGIRTPNTGVKLDFTAANPHLQQVDLSDTDAFSAWVFGNILEAGAEFGYGGYLENRTVYAKSSLFEGTEPRSMHLGVDIWMPAGAEVFLPYPGTLHSLQDNASKGDYGPTLIFAHEIEGIPFYTLYGHLSRPSLYNKDVGDEFSAGAQIAWLGEPFENVDWPPHLHFQIIREMGNYSGDFPGVCRPSEQEYWKGLCPDPQVILRIEDHS